jgi:membrane protein
MRGVLSRTFNEFLEDKAERLAAALAYYAVFSISPLLIIIVALVDFLYTGDSLEHVRNQIALMLGDNAAQAIVATIRGVNSSPSGVLATIVSIFTLLIGSTAVFTQLQDAMNTIWGVTPKPRQYLTEMLRSRVLSFAMVAGISFLLLVSLIVSAILAAVSGYFRNLIPGVEFIWQVVDFSVSFTVTAALFALMYKVLPDVKIGWRDVWVGAAATAVLFSIGKILIGFYLGRSTLASAYGAAGSVMVLLAWVYYSCLVLLLGAEFTQVYANSYGSRVRPARGAIFLSEEQRIRQGIPHFETIRERFAQRERDFGTRPATSVHNAYPRENPSAGRRRLSGRIRLDDDSDQSSSGKT